MIMLEVVTGHVTCLRRTAWKRPRTYEGLSHLEP